MNLICQALFVLCWISSIALVAAQTTPTVAPTTLPPTSVPTSIPTPVPTSYPTTSYPTSIPTSAPTYGPASQSVVYSIIFGTLFGIFGLTSIYFVYGYYSYEQELKERISEAVQEAEEKRRRAKEEGSGSVANYGSNDSTISRSRDFEIDEEPTEENPLLGSSQF